MYFKLTTRFRVDCINPLTIHNKALYLYILIIRCARMPAGAAGGTCNVVTCTPAAGSAQSRHGHAPETATPTQARELLGKHRLDSSALLLLYSTLVFSTPTLQGGTHTHRLTDVYHPDTLHLRGSESTSARTAGRGVFLRVAGRAAPSGTLSRAVRGCYGGNIYSIYRRSHGRAGGYCSESMLGLLLLLPSGRRESRICVVARLASR